MVELVCGKGWLAVWQEAPIYDRLVTERGDVPTQVRREAEQTLRSLEQVIRLGAVPAGMPSQHAQPFPPGR
ncbi:hypothetical protein QRN89_02325 [Streptomyces chengbuensis]|uniref:hypothetical protein n=1 Tax=Streptomyces TaxID=1883 RepID=UPI0025B46B9C|nr:hypothetical protein [Streptomyces sp. HUAS CB01]WJY55072.1 hypothetical protein QRN89_02325 [Streptomyces sp. HUAS CB01]